MGSRFQIVLKKTHRLYILQKKSKMRPFFVILALAIVAVQGQRQGRRNGRRGGQRQGRQEEDGVQADASSLSESHEGDHQGLDWLLNSVPGTPGEDYPILAEVPETAFSCDGQVEGGYYGDIDTECQAFHVCTADGQGGLSKYSFLCPNGTIFNQGYFICDWWFNFDCAEAEGLFSLNEDIAAEREAASQPQGAASDAQASYAAPAEPLSDYSADRQGR